MTIEAACGVYLADAQARNLARATIKGYQGLFKLLQKFAATRSISELERFDRDAVREWRDSWSCAPATRHLRLQRLGAFFRFAMHEGWLASSPMKGLKPPKLDAKPTMPFTRNEVRAFLETVPEFSRERAFFLLLRNSGLAIVDAATLPVASVGKRVLTLRRSKSGELVTVALPEIAIRELQNVERSSADYFFWTGKGLKSTAAKYWRRRLQEIAKKAGIEDFKPHRLRDTFAIEMLKAGISMTDLSVLLGHSSVKTTERYYAPWDPSRRKRLERLVRRANKKDPILAELEDGAKPKRSAGAVGAAPANGSAAEILTGMRTERSLEYTT